jgi:hypothetical protein
MLLIYPLKLNNDKDSNDRDIDGIDLFEELKSYD